MPDGDPGEPAGGYFHPDYPAVYGEFGRPRRLAESGGWLLERRIPGAALSDGMGCYPLFSCARWEGLRADLEALRRELVSVVLVADPFAACSETLLARTFDRVLPYKRHWIAELDRPLGAIVTSSRRKAADAALARIDVERVPDPLRYLDAWIELHGCLAQRHRLDGMRALPRTALRTLFQVPGFVMLRATYQGETVGMHLEMQQGEVVFGHLAAYSPLGRRLGASTALHVWEIEYFMGRARAIDWGGAAGTEAAMEDGLTNFKRGFSTTSRIAHLCGRVLDRKAYAALCDGRRIADDDYFPAYRRGEFS